MRTRTTGCFTWRFTSAVPRCTPQSLKLIATACEMNRASVMGATILITTASTLTRREKVVAELRNFW